ncbi:DUF1573 domain-containing protein [Natronoflexus pectinivorans]|uniref:Uncharacterized protein DUF1573 n=1 Tax=Natronoflexus pectinivorans TaxID=682526 RepID=A0A4R2GML4_9BACT|nr:DUF1573 domain-containing protein [Natronoflexus pectinivorans]TCO10463.1 uncharacterized protein DUF1573 [Natronoflexus pectinivorans]
MKRVIIIAVIGVAFAIIAKASQPEGPELTFEESGLNYGTVTTDNIPGGKVTIVFTNTGDEPLVLSNVRACCGTRVERYPRQPIAPGVKDSINVSFNLAQRPQRINRVVTVNSNCRNNFAHTWRITGQVVANEE